MSTNINKFIALFSLFLLSPLVSRVWAQPTPASDFRIDPGGLPILGFGDLLTFAIRMIFIVAGLAALVYGLLGGIAWITSGGGKDEIQGARDKIQAAIVGIFVLIVVLTIIWTLETVVFRRSICFGISCNVRIPGLRITPLPGNRCSDWCAVWQQDKGYRNGQCVVDAAACTGINGTIDNPVPDPARTDGRDSQGNKTECPGSASPNCCCTF